MRITPQDVQRIAALAHLELTSEEQASMQNDLTAILSYVNQLSELDTSHVEPMTRPSEIAQIGSEGDSLRNDESRPSLTRESVLQAAPQAEEGFFRVPRVIVR